MITPIVYCWSLERKIVGYSGAGYVVWRGKPISGNSSQPDADPARFLHFAIKIDDPGKYYIKLRNYHEMLDGDNDVFVRTPGRKDSIFLKYYDHDRGSWTMDETGEWAVHMLSEGIHTIEIAGRSRGFAIDKIIIYKEGTVIEKSG